MNTQSLAGLRVLILEDEFLIAMDIEQLCSDHGARECVIARSLSEAGDTANFDVAIVDLKLGAESNLDHARELRRRGIPFIFATGYSGVEQADREFADVKVVEKPYQGADLVEALVAALRKPAASASDG